MKVLLFRGRGLISTLIRWQTRSRQFSHAALLFDDGALFEAWQGKGVWQTTLKSKENVTFFEFVTPLSDEQKRKARKLAESFVGAGYDYTGVLRFVSRRIKDTVDRQFCSEFVMRVCAGIGADLLRLEPERAAPETLSFSTVIRPQ